MSKNINLDLKSIKPSLEKTLKRFSKHAAFVAVVTVLLVYMFLVWQISSLTSTEPSAEAESAALAETTIPRVNREAVEQIQSLEQNSTKIQSLFDQARNNPFQE